MTTNFNNFKSWYADILLNLFKLYSSDQNSGFVILMVTFPLLERYLRHKNGLTYKNDLSNGFMDDLYKMFPVLPNRKAACDFWNVYRNGILHQVTLSRVNRKGKNMPDGWLSHKINSAISVESDGSFLIHPVRFSEQVLHIIENDFATFEQGPPASTKLPKEKFHPTANILGTNTEL